MKYSPAPSSNAIPIDKLSEYQKRKLTIDCWNHGVWDCHLFIGDRRITKPQAINAVKEVGSALGKELVQLSMTGHAQVYKTFFPHDEEKYPLVRMIGKPAGIVMSQLATVTPPSPFKVCNHLSVTVYIYKLDTNHNATYFGEIKPRPAQGFAITRTTYTPDFTGQWWVHGTCI